MDILTSYLLFSNFFLSPKNTEIIEEQPYFSDYTVPSAVMIFREYTGYEHADFHANKFIFEWIKTIVEIEKRKVIPLSPRRTNRLLMCNVSQQWDHFLPSRNMYPYMPIMPI